MKIIITKANITVLFSILVGSSFFLSVFGKYFDLAAFQKTILIYGFPYYTSYIVLVIETILGISFISLVFLKQTAKVSIIFVISLTIIYTIGHYFLNIESCNCFGRIYFLNPSSFIFFLLKNIILTLMSFYIYKNENTAVQNKIWLKRVFVVLLSLIIVFSSFKYNAYYVQNYAHKNIGMSLEEFNIDTEKIKNFDYLFFFSPTCIHCRNAIPKINLLKEKYSMNIVGIISKSKEEELKKISSNLKINFPIIIIDKKVFNSITILVPVVFKIENNTVKKVLKIKELLLTQNL